MMADGGKDRRSWWLIPIAAAIVVLPMCVHGASYGHDFNFHLLNWMEAARQFRHGIMYPRWAVSPAYNAGEPRFVFYPPASWTVGAFISLVVTHLPGMSTEAAWGAVPIVFTGVCLATAGLSLYVAARRFANDSAALIGAVLYIANPYMLFTAYERSAYAELLAAAWMPLLISELLLPKVSVLRIAVPLALLWLTNAPAAVIGCYAIVGFVALRVIVGLAEGSASVTGSIREIALPSATGTILGLGLSAFYLIPAAWERRYVQVAMATIVNMRIDHNFLFEHTGDSAEAVTHDQVLRTASWIAVALVVAATLAICTYGLQRRIQPLAAELKRLPVYLLVTIAVISFLLTGWSNAVWQHTPEKPFQGGVGPLDAGLKQ